MTQKDPRRGPGSIKKTSRSTAGRLVGPEEAGSAIRTARAARNAPRKGARVHLGVLLASPAHAPLKLYLVDFSYKGATSRLFSRPPTPDPRGRRIRLACGHCRRPRKKLKPEIERRKANGATKV